MKGLMFALLLLAAPAGLTMPLTSPVVAQPAGDIGVAMQRLQAKILALGAPSLKGEGSIHGKTVPVLYFGQTQVNDNFALLDDAGKEVGGAATIFVKSGDEFVRVVTNVTKSDGSRGIGTVLNRKGKAFAALRKGESFSDVVNIRGKRYFTRYEPIRDADNAMYRAKRRGGDQVAWAVTHLS